MPQTEAAALDSPAIEGRVISRGMAGVDLTPRKQTTVTAARTLGVTRALFDFHGYWPSPPALDAAVLWTVGAQVREADGELAWFSFPKAFMRGAPGSGKTTLMELMALACGTSIATDVSPKAMKDTFGLHRKPLFIDQAHETITAALRRNLTAGYTRGQFAYSTSGGQLTETSIFGAACWAGTEVFDTDQADRNMELLKRTIIWYVSEAPHRIQQFDRRTLEIGAIAHESITAWTKANLHLLIAAEEQLQKEWAAGHGSKGATSRSAQLWRPLRAVARVADMESAVDGQRTSVRWEQSIVDAEASMHARDLTDDVAWAMAQLTDEKELS
jgi:hypothetical protein